LLLVSIPAEKEGRKGEAGLRRSPGVAEQPHNPYLAAASPGRSILKDVPRLGAGQGTTLPLTMAT